MNVHPWWKSLFEVWKLYHTWTARNISMQGIQISKLKRNFSMMEIHIHMPWPPWTLSIVWPQTCAWVWKSVCLLCGVHFACLPTPDPFHPFAKLSTPHSSSSSCCEVHIPIVLFSSIAHIGNSPKVTLSFGLPNVLWATLCLKFKNSVEIARQLLRNLGLPTNFISQAATIQKSTQLLLLLLLLSFLDGSFKFKRRPFKIPSKVSSGMYREINVKGFWVQFHFLFVFNFN